MENLSEQLVQAELIQSFIEQLANAIKEGNWEKTIDTLNRLYAYRDNILDKVKYDDPSLT